MLQVMLIIIFTAFPTVVSLSTCGVLRWYTDIELVASAHAFPRPCEVCSVRVWYKSVREALWFGRAFWLALGAASVILTGEVTKGECVRSIFSAWTSKKAIYSANTRITCETICNAKSVHVLPYNYHPASRNRVWLIIRCCNKNPKPENT